MIAATLLILSFGMDEANAYRWNYATDIGFYNNFNCPKGYQAMCPGLKCYTEADGWPSWVGYCASWRLQDCRCARFTDPDTWEGVLCRVNKWELGGELPIGTPGKKYTHTSCTVGGKPGETYPGTCLDEECIAVNDTDFIQYWLDRGFTFPGGIYSR